MAPLRIPVVAVAIVFGLGFGAFGALFILTAIGTFGDRWSGAQAWIGICAGMVFILSGLALIVGYGVAAGDDDTPLVVRVIQHLLGIGVVVAMAMIATWVALQTPGRRAAQLGATALWLFVAVMIVISARQLRRR